MSDWIPPGYVHVTALIGQHRHGLKGVRNDLFAGRLQAYKWDGTAGNLEEIEPRFWCANGIEQSLAEGWFAHRIDGLPPCMIIVKEEPKPATDGAYVPEYMALMQEAIQHFQISEQSWPKKKELVAYFMAKTLNGKPILPTTAGYLATFCRPPEAKNDG